MQCHDVYPACVALCNVLVSLNAYIGLMFEATPSSCNGESTSGNEGLCVQSNM